MPKSHWFLASTHITFNVIGTCNTHPKPQSHKDMLRPLTCELLFQNSLIMGSLGSKSIKWNVTKPTTLFLRILCHPKFVIIILVPRSLVLYNRHHVPCIMTTSIIPVLSILNIWRHRGLTALEEQGTTQWWECLPPTNVAQVHILASTDHYLLIYLCIYTQGCRLSQN